MSAFSRSHIHDRMVREGTNAKLPMASSRNGSIRQLLQPQIAASRHTLDKAEHCSKVSTNSRGESRVILKQPSDNDVRIHRSG